MAQSDFSPSAIAENNTYTPKAPFPQCLQLPGGDGGGFHVAKGKQGASWKPATSRQGTCRGGLFRQSLGGGGSVRVLAFLAWLSCFQQTAKNKTEEPVYLVPEIAEVLNAYRPAHWSPSALVFPNGIPRASRLQGGCGAGQGCLQG
jgi:hypothetical protein